MEGLPNKTESYAKDLEQEIEEYLELFPDSLRTQHEQIIMDMSPDEALLFLRNKYSERTHALQYEGIQNLPEGVEVAYTIPAAIRNDIEIAKAQREQYFIDAGKNGEVFAGVYQPEVCYKVLFSEKAKIFSTDIGKEVSSQYHIHNMVKDCPDCAKVPEVYMVVNDGELQAIMMQRVQGYSLRDIVERGIGSFPNDFDVDTFFTKISNTLDIMHEHGYFHNDLTGNLGNVMIGLDGEPWIIDFAAAVKSLDSGDPKFYKLIMHGSYHPEKDTRGVEILKRRVRGYMEAGI